MGTRRNSEAAGPRLRTGPAILVALIALAIGAAAPSAAAATTSAGQLYAFGDNYYGQLGSARNNGVTKANPTPTLVDLPGGTTIDAVAPGPSAYHTLVLIADLAVTNSSLSKGHVGIPYSAGAHGERRHTPLLVAGERTASRALDLRRGQISGIPTRAGTARVSLSVRDRFGMGAARPAEIGAAKVSSVEGRRKKKRAPRGTTFSFRLNTGAKVRLAFAKHGKGRKHRRSTRATLSFAGHPGTNRVVFQGRISRHRKLRPNRYRLTATASAGGERSKPRSLSFTIVQ
jgi:Regulator of chromosome condensation (RCC1) repeat